MTQAICFRCEWRGRAVRRRCPSCGATLHRPRGRDARVDSAEDAPGRRSGGFSRAPRGVAFGLAVVLALASVVTIELLAADDPPPEASSTDLGSGTLVYLVAAGEGPASLWLFDLSTGVVQPGPVVPRRTEQLVDLSGAGHGWVGLEHRARRGRVVAAAVEGLGAAADVVRLGRGDLVAWGPRGASLVFARNGRHGSHGCAPVRISLVNVVSRTERWALDDPGFCGPVLALSRSAAATYFTAASGDRLSVYLTGSVGVPHLMFEGLGMISAAPPSAFLLANGRGSVGGEARLRPRTLLGWKGIGGPVAVGRDGEDLVLRRILAWSPDGARAAVVGSVGGRRGVFVLEAGSGADPRTPSYVMAPASGVDATFDAEGRLYLSVGGRIVVVRDSSRADLPLPRGAPRPTGPIVWIP